MARISALQLAVPALDALQRRLGRDLPDGATVLDPAHVSLGYPWLGAEEALVRAEEVAALVASHDPVEVTFDGPERFGPDGRGRTTLWLAPSPSGPIEDLGAAIADLTGRPEEVVPHSSMVRLPDGVDPSPFVRRIVDAMPVSTVLDRVDLHVQAAGGWRHVRTMPLRGH